MKFFRRAALSLVVICFLVSSSSAELTEDAEAKRIEELERSTEQLVEQVRAMQEEIQRLKQERSEERARGTERERRVSGLATRVEEIGTPGLLELEPSVSKFTLGGYGEMHANFTEGPGDKLDIHRFVLYLGYDFNDWIKFHSEIEIEHAFVADGSGGELSLEQVYVDFLLSEPLNLRVGRVLTPVGIINQKHEPTTFHGVERPSFAKFIIPTTWSSDGVGFFGSLSPSVKYEAYVVGGLDGSGFDAREGIRGGRIKERPSLQEPAFTARLDYYPFAEREVSLGQTLRLGVSTYLGGLDNGNRGKDPGVDGDIQLYSGDFEYSISEFDFRGAIAYTDIVGAREIGKGTASEIFGWYLEAAYHFWPDAWKRGLLAQADAVAFLRYDNFDTQHVMPSGVARDPRGDRDELTLGLSFFPTSNFVIKADYQIRDDESSEDPNDLFNLGVGWQF